MGFEVCDVGYFVYANGMKERDKFDAKLEFEMLILDHTGDDSWVEPAVEEIKECLEGDEMPESGEGCEYCKYRALIKEVETGSEEVI